MKRLYIITLLIGCAIGAYAQEVTFETATEAVANMKIGWNLGNTLDSHTGYNGSDIRYWETIWSEPLTKPTVKVIFRRPFRLFCSSNNGGKETNDWLG